MKGINKYNDEYDDEFYLNWSSVTLFDFDHLIQCFFRIIYAFFYMERVVGNPKLNTIHVKTIRL
jgi:hypothetical protein